MSGVCKVVETLDTTSKPTKTESKNMARSAISLLINSLATI
jgi:hypothetical protein